MANFDCNIYRDLIRRHSSLFFDENRKDVTFVFGESEEKVKAHKNILEAASPVFMSMFSGFYAEKDEVEIDDISPEVFKLFISGIYLNDIYSQVKTDRPVETFAELYYAAEKYDIKDIRELSENYMLDNCDTGNTNFLFEKAKLFNLSDLEAVCKDYFHTQTYKLLASHIGLALNDNFFHEFFDMDNLAIKSEFDLYIGLQAMVDSKKLKNHSKCLSKIRFLTMESTDILSCKLLSDKKKVAVMSNIEGKKIRSMPAHLSVENKPRKFDLEWSEYDRQYFWTAIMLKSIKYEDYYEDFFKQMNILEDSKVRTKALITEGRNKADEEGNISLYDIHDITSNIFVI